MFTPPYLCVARITPGGFNTDYVPHMWVVLSLSYHTMILRCFFKGYASLLFIWALSTNPTWSRVLIRHSEVVLLVTWTVFMYRDIWPLGTYTLQPADIHEGPIFWVKFGILTLGAIIVPLVIPHQYIPYDPEVSIWARKVDFGDL